jgi:hypothetical protein
MFRVNAGVHFTLRGLVLVNGLSTNGGAILNDGTLELYRCTFSNNTARGMPVNLGRTSGGAVFSSGTLRVTDCVFADNVATAVRNEAAGGAIYATGPLTVNGSFFSGNRAAGAVTDFFPTLAAAGYGGAIYSGNALSITNSTFVGNRSAGGSASGTPSRGGDAFGGAISATAAAFVNCTFASNIVTAGFGIAGLCGPGPPLCGGPGNAAGSAIYSGASAFYNNLIVDPATNNAVVAASVTGGQNLFGGDELQLLAPAANGGITPNMALLPASPAIDSAEASACPATDQRGVPRPAGAGCDIGAFEYSDPLRFPALSPSFTPADLRSNAPGFLSFVVSNRSDVALSSLALAILLPTNVVAIPATAMACPATIGNPSQNSITVSGLSLAPHAACELHVPVTSAVLGRWSNVTVTAAAPVLGSRTEIKPAVLTVAAPPLAATDTESQVNATSGRLNGRVTPNGAPTLAWFEWGDSPNLGNTTEGIGVGDSYLPSSFSIQLNNLIAGTPVYLRAVASNAFGVSHGTVLSFYPSDGIVRNCEEEDLRANLANGTVVVRFGCDGTIALKTPLELTRDVILDGTGRNVRLSGSNRVRVLRVPAGINVTLRGITITDGSSSQGGGILNEGGLVLLDCQVMGNEAIGTNGVNGPGGVGAGGGIWNSGNLLASNTVLVANTARGGVGAAGISGGSAVDAIDPFGRCRSIVIPTYGTPGFAGGDGRGGGLFNVGTVRLVNVLVSSNRCIGGLGGTGGGGGRGGCTAISTSAQSGGGGGPSAGGGICNAGTLFFTGTTIHHNESAGGTGGQGGYNWSPMFIGPSSGGGRGGNGFGGAVWNTGSNQCDNSTIAENLASGGTGGRGGQNLAICPESASGSGGEGDGGGIRNGIDAVFQGSFLTIWNNQAMGGLAGPATNCTPTWASSNGMAIGTSIRNTGGIVELLGSIVGNLSATSSVDGPILDGGGNLSSDGSAHFTAPDSRNGVDPRLGPLTDNGGPTLTYMPLAGSPAINGASTSECPPIDQRGVTRPMAGGCDIGAVEWVPAELRFVAIERESGTVKLRGYGAPGSPFTLQRTEDFGTWEPVGNGTVAPDATFGIEHSSGPGHGFYRLNSP